MNDVVENQNRVLITCKTLAKMLSVSQRTTWRLRSAGKLPKPISIGSSVRWKLSDIELFLQCDCDMSKFNAEKAAGK